MAAYKRMGALVVKFSCVDFTISGLENGQTTVLNFFSIFPKNFLISRMPIRLQEFMLTPLGVGGGLLFSAELSAMGRGLKE